MATRDKGEQIFDSLLLDQYSSSPNFKEYCMCFISEMDFLFESIEESYTGRMLEGAVGVQQDIIGIILDEGRNIVLPNNYFGFAGAPGALKMADEDTPADGGIFRSEEESGFTVTPLSDALFKRVLSAKASILNNDTTNVEDMYNCIHILLGRALSNIGVSFPVAGHVQLEISASEVTASEEALIQYASKWFIPAGKHFTINKV